MARGSREQSAPGADEAHVQHEVLGIDPLVAERLQAVDHGVPGPPHVVPLRVDRDRVAHVVNAHEAPLVLHGVGGRHDAVLLGRLPGHPE